MKRKSKNLDPACLQAVQDAMDFSTERPLRERLALLGKARELVLADDPAAAVVLDDFVLRRFSSVTQEARRMHDGLQQEIEKLTELPHFPAVFLSGAPEGRAWVAIEGSGERIVSIHEEVGDLEKGDWVLLNAKRSIILGTAPGRHAGELAQFKRLSGNGHLIVNHQGTDLMCEVVNGLEADDLRPGDAVLIDRNRFAIEKVEEVRTGRLPYEVEEFADLSPADLGGLDAEFELVFSAVEMSAFPDIARRFRNEGVSILLEGPPGTGKTRLAMIAAAELERRHGRRVRFLSIKPSEWTSEWHGVTQRNIRENFAAIRRVVEESPDVHVVVFFDEVESMGRIRGGSRAHQFIDDHCTALLAELDGFQGLKSVSIISASNRKDLIDPALLERLAHIDVPVPRPKMEAARAIFGVHLAESDPWAGSETRGVSIETALAMLYTGEDNVVSRIAFNDGSGRVVTAADLISGRMIRSIGTTARRSAARRAIESGDQDGVLEVRDVVDAVEDGIDGLRTRLSKENAHSYLGDLPQDLAIVSVEPVWPNPRRINQYLND